MRSLPTTLQQVAGFQQIRGHVDAMLDAMLSLVERNLVQLVLLLTLYLMGYKLRQF